MSTEINTEQLLMLVKELKGKDESRSKWYVGPMVTVLIAVITAFVSWGMMMKTSEYVQNRLDVCETKLAQHDLEIAQLKLQSGKDSVIISQIKETVGEVKVNVQRLIDRKLK